MRAGSIASDPAPQRADHEVVRRLRAAGAVVVGLTRVPELCVFGATNSRFGVTRNPWNRSAHPRRVVGRLGCRRGRGHGGRGPRQRRHGLDPHPSGLLRAGRDQARAAAWCPSELGNGSWFGMAENGPLATTVDDCALLLSVMAGRPELASVGDPGRAPRRGLDQRPRRRSSLSTGTGPPPRAQTGAAAARRRPPGQRGRPAVRTAHRAVGDRPLGRGHRARRPPARQPVEAGATHPAPRRRSAAWRSASGFPREAGRERWRRAAERFFADHDVLVTPALAQPPIAAARVGSSAAGPPTSSPTSGTRPSPRRGTWRAGRRWRCRRACTPTARRCPCSWCARPGGEALLLAVARQLEALRPWPRTAPLR